MNELQKSIDYRLSRAPRTIENTFTILVARWRFSHEPIRAIAENVKTYTLACFSLRLTENAVCCQSGFVDSVDYTGKGQRKRPEIISTK